MMALQARLVRALPSLALCAIVASETKAQAIATAPPQDQACLATGASFADPFGRPHWNGWGVDATQRRFQPSDMTGLSAEEVPRLKLKWAFGFPGANRVVAQPTIVGGRVFVGSQRGKVYALDASSGCTHWEFSAGAGVRSAIVIGRHANGWAAYFGDQGAKVYAVDAATGTALWTTRIEDHPAAVITGAPTLIGTTLFVAVSSYEERLATNPGYACCTFRGSLAALDTVSGRLLWKRYTVSDEPKPGVINSAGTPMMGPSGAAIWSAPTYDTMRHLVYVTTGDNYSDPPTDTSDAILAVHADTGDLAWSRQLTELDAYNMGCNMPSRANCPQAKGPDHDFGSSVILVDLVDGKRALIGAQKSGVVTALDPDRGGDILWQTRVGLGGTLGGVQWGAAADQTKAYVAVSDVKLSIVAAGTPGAQTLATNPSQALLLDGAAGGGLHALDITTGKAVWRTQHPGCNAIPGCSPAQSAAVTVMPRVVFSGGLDGHLRAYSAADGMIVWDVDTKVEYRTVNGVPAKGGSIDGGGTVIAGGMLYAGSGSGIFGSTPGNVLLAYSVDGR